MDKKQWSIDKQKELESSMKDFIKNTAIDESKITDLINHYKISGLYNFSFHNSCLIALQGGTICQSYKNWKKLNRYVRKGEKARIHIFRPVVFKKNDDDDDKKTFTRFFLVPTFDIEQTDGNPLEYEHNSINVNIEYIPVKHKLQKIIKVPIVEKITGNHRGYCSESEIGVSEMSNNADKIRTLIHEVAHHLLKHVGNHENITKSTKEVEAETVTHFVLSYMDIEYSLSESYIASWKNEHTVSHVNYKQLLKVTDQIIKALQTF